MLKQARRFDNDIDMELNALLKKRCKAWELGTPELLFESVLANIYRVQLPSGETGALKLFTPRGLEDEWDGARLLNWYAGNGAVDVVAIGNGALLMKWLGGESLMALCDTGRANEAALIIARLAAQVRAQKAIPPPLKTVEQRFEALFEFDEARIPIEFLAVFQQAKRVAASMLTDVQHVPLHGDLHFRNVLSDGYGWLLIDPKGLMGPPAYDLANLFINPWDRPEIVLAPNRAISLARLLAKETGYPASDLIGWAIAHAAIAAVWHIPVGGSGRHPLKMLGVLFDARAKLA